MRINAISVKSLDNERIHKEYMIDMALAIIAQHWYITVSRSEDHFILFSGSYVRPVIINAVYLCSLTWWPLLTQGWVFEMWASKNEDVYF